RLAMPQGEQRRGGERGPRPTGPRSGIGEHPTQFTSWSGDPLPAIDQLVRLEHLDELLRESELSLEPVVAGAPDIRKRAFDLSPQEAGQDHVRVVAELWRVNVALVGDELESPGELAGHNLLVEPIDQPADRGHPG